MMKILHVNVCASSGSTGKIVTSIAKVLNANGHDSIICYGANETVDADGYYRFCTEPIRAINALSSRITGIMYGGYPKWSTNKLIKKITSEKPYIVHLHCINGFTIDVFKLLEFLATNSYNTVLTLHAEFMFTGLCSHAFDCNKWKIEGCNSCHRSRSISKSLFDRAAYSWSKLKKVYDLFDKAHLKIVSVSPWLSQRADESIMLHRFSKYVVFNGIDTDIFHYISPRAIHFDYNLPDKYCLFVTASFSTDKNDNKGGCYLVELAKRKPDIQFIVASNYTGRTDGLPYNILMLGRTKTQQELSYLYNRASVTVLLSKGETFSMVTAESLCCGTPVVGFKAGGPESIALKDYSEFSEYGDLDTLDKNLTTWFYKSIDKKKISDEALNIYSENAMTDTYLDVYKSFDNIR